MLFRGARVVVRTPAAIAATLDGDGTLDGLPWMAEMLAACGRTFTVSMPVERVCVRGVGPEETALRRLDGCVVLEGLRCDGSAHDGCQRGCMLLWKEAWLAPAGTADAAGAGEPAVALPHRTGREGPPPGPGCQGTELLRATRPCPSRWSPGPYLRMLRYRTLTPLQLGSMMVRTALSRLERAAGARRGASAPVRGQGGALRLRPGDWVEVKSAAEIRATLDVAGRHRGLAFTADMTVHCGRTLRVAGPVERIIEEETGRACAVEGTVTLEGAACRRHLGCARQMPFLWREAWLRRAPVELERAGRSLARPPLSRRGYLMAKRAVDLTGAALGLVLLSPVLAAIALAVRLSSPGPILFRQERVGLHGRPFTLLKFRSMTSGPGPAVTAAGDARVTRVGRVLRRAKLDELPQLWNVVRGDMSLVGPRPELARYVRLFPAEYRRILSIRPGLTDFAAIAYRDEEALLAGAASPEAVYTAVVLPAKLSLYQRYLDEMSVRTDLALLLRTLAAVLP